jgi:hypothetical protein
MVFRGWPQRKNLLSTVVVHEQKHLYVQGITSLRNSGWKVQAVVCDGKPGLFTAFESIPVQMCHVHQIRIVTRYITTKPQLQASKELLALLQWLPQTDCATFTSLLKQWYATWKTFLAEKTVNPLTGRWQYTHRRLLSAFKSLQKNLPYLFTFEQHPNIPIPTTTNSLEGVFSQLKRKVNAHPGLKRHRKIKLICELLF